MSVYIPDSWVIIKIIKGELTYYKVLAGFSGGFAYGDSWKLNSGITSIDDEGNYYVVHGCSSSSYNCSKSGEGLRMITSGIYGQLQDRLGDDVEIVDMADVDEEYFLEVNGE